MLVNNQVSLNKKFMKRQLQKAKEANTDYKDETIISGSKLIESSNLGVKIEE